MQAPSQPVKLWNNKAEQDKYDKHAGKRLRHGEVRVAVTLQFLVGLVDLCKGNSDRLRSRLISFTTVDLFAIIKMLDKLEQAYIRDAVTAKEYEPACERLISQYKTLYETMRELVSMRH